MAHALSWPDVWGRRLARHALLERVPAARLVDIAGAVCGIHAQIMAAAELSLGVRVAGIRRSDVRAALWDSRQLVKTYGIRGTVHLLPAEELPLWMAALRCRSDVREQRRLDLAGLNAQQLPAVVDAIGRALDGQRLTTQQLGDEVARLTGAWALDPTAPAFGGRWPRWRMALGSAAAAGQLCFGPNDGAQVTFVRPDQWLGTWHELEPRAALRTVYRRFLSAYGPSTLAEFAQWFAIPRQLARAVQSEVESELVTVYVEGDRRMMLSADLDEVVPSAADNVRLLPLFDCYLRGGHPRQRLVGGWADRSAGGTGQTPVLVVGGTVGGVWQYKPRARIVELLVEPFVPLSSRQRDALAEEAVRVGEILESEVKLTIGTVTVRPHL